MQYNEDLNLVSFVQRANTTYPASPAPNATTASGVVIAKVSANWGSNWDSTCLWSDVQNAARYPQGAVTIHPVTKIVQMRMYWVQVRRYPYPAPGQAIGRPVNNSVVPITTPV